VSPCPLRNWGTIRPGRMSVSFSGNLPARMRRRKTAARRALESISVAPWVASGVGRSMFPSPPKPRAQPTQEGRNQESSNWYQHLWLRPQPATSTFEEESSHDDGSPDPHVGNKGSQHDEDCSHYPLDHERKRIRECGLVACLQSVWKNVGGLRSKRTEQTKYRCPALSQCVRVRNYFYWQARLPVGPERWLWHRVRTRRPRELQGSGTQRPPC